MNILKTLSKSPFSSKYLSWISYYFLPFFAILIMRNGINFWGYDYYAIAWAKEWPKPVSQFSVEDSGNLMLAKLFAIDTRLSWMVLHAVLTGLFIILAAFLVSREKLSNIQKRALFILILSSALTMMLMQEIGYFDVITIIGALTLAFGNSMAIRILGTIVMCSGNTPQTLIATLLFGTLISLTQNRKKYDIDLRLFIPFVVACIIWILERLWLGGLGREAEFGPGMWLYSTKGFLIASPLYLYALLGPIWFIAPTAAEKMKGFTPKRLFLIFTVLILVPALFGIVTTESTRDALCIMSPALLWFFKYLVSERQLVLSRIQILALALMPSFLVWREGAIVEPWSVLQRFFF